MLSHSFSRARRGAALIAAVVSVFTAACSSDGTGLNGNQMDKSPPTVSLSKGGTSADTVLSFQVEVKDNLGIKNVKVNLTGGLTMSFDTTFTSANTDAIVPFTISVPRSIPKGTPVLVTSFALDGNGNKSATDTLNLTGGGEIGVLNSATISANISGTGRDIVELTEVQPNVAIDAAKFAKPAPAVAPK